jgi:hypothetical protein
MLLTGTLATIVPVIWYTAVVNDGQFVVRRSRQSGSREVGTRDSGLANHPSASRHTRMQIGDSHLAATMPRDHLDPAERKHTITLFPHPNDHPQWWNHRQSQQRRHQRSVLPATITTTTTTGTNLTIGSVEDEAHRRRKEYLPRLPSLLFVASVRIPRSHPTTSVPSVVRCTVVWHVAKSTN